MAGGEVLSDRALGRATLARQLLLARDDRPVLDAVEHLVGLQAQEPRDPYLGLWSRLAGFRPDDLAGLLVERRAVRIVAMRATLHLLSTDDAVELRALAQPVLDKELPRHRDHGPVLVGVDLAPVLAAARPLLAEPRSGTELRALLAERFPGLDAAALAYACRNHLGLVQAPPRGLWDRSGQVRSTTVEAWLGRPLAEHPSVEAAALRYLAAFGPASAADLAAWSGLTGMAEVVERLAPRLRPFRDERGRALVDLPDAPRPAPATPAPVRFLPQYDNALLSHADRRRFGPDDDRARLARGPGPVQGSVLVDGQLRGTWRLDRSAETPGLVVDHVGRFPARTASSVVAEGRRALRFLQDGTSGEVRLAPLG